MFIPFGMYEWESWERKSIVFKSHHHPFLHQDLSHTTNGRSSRSMRMLLRMLAFEVSTPAATMHEHIFKIPWDPRSVKPTLRRWRCARCWAVRFFSPTLPRLKPCPKPRHHFTAYCRLIWLFWFFYYVKNRRLNLHDGCYSRDVDGLHCVNELRAPHQSC